MQALELKEQYEEAKQLHLECKNIEKVLLRHTQEALEEYHSSSLVNECTNLLTGDVLSILQHLDCNYSKI